MAFDAPHIDFVLASYALSVIVMAVLVAMYVLRSRRVGRRLAELESSGAPRRRTADGATQ